MATRKTMAQVPIRNRGDNRCPYRYVEVILACRDCNGELVCSQCITSRHHRHGFENISQVAGNKKHNIQEYVKKVENTQLSTITNNLQSIDRQIEENTNHFKALIQKITLQGETMKNEIDKITNEMTEKCRTIEKQNYELLSKFKTDLKSLYTQLNKIIDECKDTLKTENEVMIIDMERDIQQELELPNAPKCRTAEFAVGSKSSKRLQDDFGTLSIGKLVESNHVPNTQQELVLSNISKHNKIIKVTGKPKSQKHLNDDVYSLFAEESQKSHHVSKSNRNYKSRASTVVAEFTHPGDIWSVEKATSDSIWLSYCDDNYISCVTLQGKVKQKIKLDSVVHDISVSPVTGNLWLCCVDKAVYEVLGTKPTKRFTTDSLSWSLCTTSDNNVVMCSGDVKVTVYSTTGQELHSTKGLISLVYPHVVTVCKGTGDIAVCDRDLLDFGGKGKPQVSVFNSKLRLKYQYYGPPVQAMKSDFEPTYVVYDSQGRLLVADNKCVQLVSGEGQFLTVVHTDTLKPRALTLIEDGLFCIGYDTGKVTVIKYRV